MKKLIYPLIVVALLLALFTAVASAGSLPDYGWSKLIAGKHIDVGRVSVTNDEDNLYVKYLVDLYINEGWCLTEAHVHVATSLEDIPQKNGNPIPGQFMYKEEYDCVPGEAKSFVHPLEPGWEPGDERYIAAHAVVMNPFTGEEETAWGVYCGSFDKWSFPGKNWAAYIFYYLEGP